MIKLDHIKEAIARADNIVGMEPDEHELGFAKYYFALALGFIVEAEERETPILSTGQGNTRERIMQIASADGWATPTVEGLIK